MPLFQLVGEHGQSLEGGMEHFEKGFPLWGVKSFYFLFPRDVSVEGYRELYRLAEPMGFQG